MPQSLKIALLIVAMALALIAGVWYKAGEDAERGAFDNAYHSQ